MLLFLAFDLVVGVTTISKAVIANKIYKYWLNVGCYNIFFRFSGVGKDIYLLVKQKLHINFGFCRSGVKKYVADCIKK